MYNSFLKNRSGNVAVMFGLFLVPLLLGAGVAIDMLRGSLVRGQMAEAIDSGLLAAARAKSLNPRLTDAEAKIIARQYFDANYTHSSDISIKAFRFTSNPSSGVFQLSVQGYIKTAILGIVGTDKTPIDIVSEAKFAPGRPLEVVMVLDTTGSMSGTKIEELKDAAELLADTLMADTDNEVKVGLVPFATHVNVGLGNISAAWLDVPEDETGESESCTFDQEASEADGCSLQETTCTNDGVPSTCSSWQCPEGVSLTYTDCETNEWTDTWDGCVGSREYPLNLQDTDFDTDPVIGILTSSCSREISAMSTDKTAVIASIDSMYTSGDTYIPSGLTWGLRVISDGLPYDEGISYAEMHDKDGTKAIVLMTDGDNTRSKSSDEHHWDSDQTEADTYTTELCDEVKSKDIQLYTVAFEITDSNTIDLIRDCATNPASFYDASDAAELSDAFESIASSLIDLALTK